jgi:E3 ubiquitin-protein ligase RNF14
MLQSIYPDCVSRDASNGSLKFEVPVELGPPMDVFVRGSGNTELQEHHLSLSSLPPILLEIVLPPAYPLRAAPEIVSFHVSGSWIPHSGPLLSKLRGMWQPGEVVLYTWVEWIRSADFLNSVNIVQDGALRYVTGRDRVADSDRKEQNPSSHTAPFAPFPDCTREQCTVIEI